ncbi:MAG: nucleotidyl transferase AbiEii/AbiGii toxin family protein [Kiritimatiellae bacterium]|nr:nucleotidyl transferase AbiEii/AbiGii toxin family protein [Kiritimatiellia bacterium]
MTLKAFYDWQTNGGGGDVTRLIDVLERLEVAWCVIGGLAVNHWAAEPVVTADVDIVVALEKVEDVVKALTKEGFVAEHFPWSINLKGRSNVSIQISTEDQYRAYPERSSPCDIWGILMRVASLEDTFKGKLADYSDKTRRPSKRQKDLLDILRLVESHPQLLSSVPDEVRQTSAFQNI